MARFTKLVNIFYFSFFVMQSTQSMNLPMHLQNFDEVKNELLPKLLGRKNGSMVLVTFTRDQRESKTTTELISHDEFKQVLKILYSLCTEREPPVYREMPFKSIPLISLIPGVDNFRTYFWRDWWNRLRIPLNTDQSTQLQDGHRHISNVDDLCSDLKHWYRERLRKSCNIVVFNEMLFSQVTPLTSQQKDFICGELLKLSKSSPNTLFYPNFLYTEERKVSGNYIQACLREMQNNAANGKMNIDHSPFCVGDCELDIQSRRLVYDNSHYYNQNFLINETYGMNCGNIVTTYRKSTYWNESNDSISRGSLYEFGRGVDFQTSQTSSQLAKTILKNISVEICFDLANSVRKNNGWNNGLGQSKIHVLQSNCIDPFDQSNIGNLPLEVPLVYSDSWFDYSKEGLLFCASVNGQREQLGEYPRSFQSVKIGDSVYTVGIYWR